MSDTPENLAGRLRREGQKTLEFFRSLSPQDWEQVIYTEGAAWKLREVLAHLVQSENSMGRLVQNIAGGGAGTPEDFQLDAYNERKVSQLQGAPVAALLEQYTRERQTNVDRVAGLAAEDLLRTGRHPFLGMTTLDEIIKMFYLHNQIHQREVRKALAAAQGEPGLAAGSQPPQDAA